jgi:hypothetical protein
MGNAIHGPAGADWREPFVGSEPRTYQTNYLEEPTLDVMSRPISMLPLIKSQIQATTGCGLTFINAEIP